MGAGGGALWLRASGFEHGEPGALIALDPATGAGRWSTPLRYNRLAYDDFCHGDGWVAASEGLPGEPSAQAVVGFDAASGERRWSLPGALLAGAGEHVFVELSHDTVAVVSGRTGERAGEIGLTAGYRSLVYWSPRALAVDGGLWLIGRDALVRVADEGGWREVERVETGGRDSGVALVWAAGQPVAAVTRESAAGSATLLLARDERGVFAEVGRAPGALRSAMGGAFVSLWTSINEKTERFTALTLGGGSASLLSVEPDRGGAIASGGDAAVSAPYGYLIVARLEAGRGSADAPILTRVSLPDEHWKSFAVGGGAAWVQSGDRLLRFELDALPEGDADATLSWWDVPAPSSSPSFYARVSALAADSARAEHPELGEVTLRGDVSGLKVRDRVTLAEVREVLPGFHQVRRWHKAHGEAAPFVPPPALSLPASALPPLPDAPASTDTAWGDALRACAAERGFGITPLMTRFMARYDTDERFRRWVNRLGIYVSISGYTSCWLGTDCAIVYFAGDMSGQAYGLYLYPPEQRPEASPPMVYWDHETREVSWQGPDFDTFLHNFLAGRARWDDEGHAGLVREALGLEAREERRQPAPGWFEDAHSAPSMGLRDAVLLAEEDPVAAERVMVALHREHEKSAPIREALDRLYQALGWRYHLRNLREAARIAGVS